MLTVRLANYILPLQLSFFGSPIQYDFVRSHLPSDKQLGYTDINTFCYDFELEYFVYEQFSSDFWFWQFVESCMQELGEYVFECSRFFNCIQQKYREYLMARASENE